MNYSFVSLFSNPCLGFVLVFLFTFPVADGLSFVGKEQSFLLSTGMSTSE